MRFLPIVAVLAALALLAPATASATRCSSTTAKSSGLGVVKIVAARTTCKVARGVGRRYAAKTRTKDHLGRTWRCRVTRRATGTDPGFAARTKVRCTRSRSVVRFELQS